MDCGFRTPLPPLGLVCFSDREQEAGKLLGLYRRGAAVPVLVYGPEGAGKSTLLRYIVWRVDRDGGLGVYIDALSGGDLEEAIYPLTSTVRGVLADVLAGAAPPLGRVLAVRLWDLLSGLLMRAEVKGRRVLVVVDGVYRALGLEEAEAYTKRLYELLGRLYGLGVESALVVVATSEGASRRLLARHSYASTSLLWNLTRDGLDELLSQIEAPISTEEAWRITGGNPRLLGRLAELEWSPGKLVAGLAEQRLAEALEAVGREALEKLVEDPDSEPEAARRLEDMNLMIRLSRVASLSPPPEPDRELGVGRDWAWQTPAYRLAALRLLE